MIKAIVGDITKLNNIDYIVNAANGVGPMGSGVAGAIRRAGGEMIQREAFEQCKKLNPQPGDMYLTSAGRLPYKGVIHLVTMKNPGGITSYNIVEKCLNTLISFCKKENIKKVALPALGTGIGRLNKEKVANIYKSILTNEDIEFYVVDIDKEFISYF